MINQLIRYLIEIPDFEVGSTETRRIRTLKAFTWLSILGVLATNVADYLQEIPSSRGANVLTLVVLFSLFWLIKKGRSELAAYLLLFAVCGLVYYDTLLLGAQLGSFIYMVVVMVAVPYIGNTEKKYQVELLAAVPLTFIVLALLVTTEPLQSLSTEQYWLSMRSNMLIFSVIMYFFMYLTVFASRRLDKKLEATALRLEGLLEQTSYVIWSVDPDYQLLQGNRNFFELYHRSFGVKLQLGEVMVGSFSEADRQFWVDKYRRTLAGESHSFIFELVMADAQALITEVSMYPVYNERKEVISIACYANDITQRVQVTRELEQNRALLSETLELAKVGVWSKEKSSGMIHWDVQCAKIMGLPSEPTEVHEQAYYQHLHPQDVERVRALVAAFEADATQFELSIGHRIITPAGEVKHVQEMAKVERNAQGELIKVNGYLQDITALRNQELLNKQTTDLLAEVKTATEELLAYDAFDDAVNQALRRVARAISAENAWVFEHRLIDGAPGAALMTPDLIGPNLPAGLPEILTEGRSYATMGVLDWYALLSKGGVKQGDASKEALSEFLQVCNLKRYVVLPIFLQNNFWGFIGFDDMDPYRTWTNNDEKIVQGFCNALGAVIRMSQYQESLKQAKEIAEQATESKTNFLSNISHEIRTPMNAIIGLTELLLPAEKDAERLEYLNAIKFSGDNLLRLINDLLDLSKIEANKMHIDVEPFRIRELLRQFEKVMAYLTQEKQLQLKFEMADDLPEVVAGDQIRLNQILLNLGSNAAKFTEKGEVAFEVKLLEEASQQLWLQIVIRDTGIGIAPDKIALIFESFEQAEKYISRKFGGTGLGLTITNKLVHMMGGSIEVQSEPGRGSIFTVKLPFEKVAQKQAAERQLSAISHKDLGGKRVLVVEDNKINIMLVTRLLRGWNASFEVAENGLEGQERLLAGNFDLILLDLQMPVMNGFELMELLRAGHCGDHPNIKVMALTADAYDQTREKALGLGFDDFITKPLNAEDLYQKIVQLIGRHQA